MRIEKIKIFGREVEVELRSDADVSVYEEVFVDRDYRVVDEVLKKARCVIDVGAHIGLFSIYAKVVNPNCRVYAFEPEESNFALLKKNLKVNHMEIAAKNVGVGRKDGIRELFLGVDSHNHSLIGEGAGRKVDCVSLNTIFARNEIVQCDLIKMDCEGAEFEILESMSGEDFGRISNFYIEYHEFRNDMRAKNLQLILQKNGFKVRIYPSHYDKTMGFIFAAKSGK